MAFQPVAQGCSAELIWAYGTVTWENVLWFKRAEFGTAEMSALGTAIGTATLSTNVLQLLDSEVTLDKVVLTDHRTEGAPQVEVDLSGKAGTVAGDIAPRKLAIVATLRTALRGRSYRGRVYVSGLAEGNLENGVWSASSLAEVDEWLTLIGNNAASEGFDWGVLSRVHNGVERASGLITTITSVEMRSAIPGTQNRRLQRP